jgi:transposase
LAQICRLIVPQAHGSRFAGHVKQLLAGQKALAHIILPLLDAWLTMRRRAAELGRQLGTSKNLLCTMRYQ